MNFDDLDAQMRVYETSHDVRVMPGVSIVARIDGRNFTRLTKELERFDAPFDPRFRDLMAGTVEHLMGCGFAVAYAYTQSDEISLLLGRGDQTFGRKERKINSVLAGEASAAFSLALGRHAAFDCRVCQLPGGQVVVDYFRWRQADAGRNALNAHCYWSLRREGAAAGEATARVAGLGTAAKHELLFARGTNFNDLPAWQKRGVGFWWEEFERAGLNPATGESTVAVRRRVRRELELPTGEAYDTLVRGRLGMGE